MIELSEDEKLMFCNNLYYVLYCPHRGEGLSDGSKNMCCTL